MDRNDEECNRKMREYQEREARENSREIWLQTNRLWGGTRNVSMTGGWSRKQKRPNHPERHMIGLSNIT